jgi:hypothetical protein
MKVSHEVPLCLLEESKKFNNYQYFLPHLADQYPEYGEFFKRYSEEGGYVIMDNSLHELGEAYNHDRLMYWVNEIKPNEFIVPDVWENAQETINNAIDWYHDKFPKETTLVAVVQAKDLNEARHCIEAFKITGYEKIAFSYGANYYNDISKHPNKDLGKALGRLQVISSLLKEGTLLPTDRIHLLGCSVPQEFSWYKGIDCIETIDTSNPVMAALEGIEYPVSGLTEKPKANMNNYFDIDRKDVNFNLVHFNALTFKKINRI